MIKEHYKHPRLYLKDPLGENLEVQLSPDQVHYLRNVLRKTVGDYIRLFNGKDGEWLGKLDVLDKKSAVVRVIENIRQQTSSARIVHLYFAPIKKARMDILVEKAVELGVCVFHPVITNRTENRKLNMERLRAQIFEAAEQCERLEIPEVCEEQNLSQVIRQAQAYPVYACLERGEAKALQSYVLPQEIGFLVGPEGGFDDTEIEMIRKSSMPLVRLGDAVLRAETASIACLVYALFSNES